MEDERREASKLHVVALMQTGHSQAGKLQHKLAFR
jgi:hypothetical protein